MSKYSKAWVAVFTAAVTTWSTYAPSGYSHWLPLVLSALGALGVYGAKNTQV